MQDLEIAKSRMNEKRLTLSIIKNREIIFDSASHGVSGFLEAVEKCREILEGTSVADRVAGKGIALLCVYVKVKAICAVTLSKRAKAVFEKYAFYHEWNSLVESIRDIDKVEVCPFENSATEISDLSEAYKRLEAMQPSFSTR